MAVWTPADIPDLSGRTALVTGATDGLGLETARMLAARCAKVILAGRNPDKGRRALARIREESPAAELAFEPFDLGDLTTVRSLAGRLGHAPIDILINNAGVMGAPQGRTTQGFETHFGVNYLGHFVLTAGLLPALRAAAAPRVVSLSSLAHRAARIDFANLQGEGRYSPWRAYGQSKLAMLLFAQELQRRSDANNWGLVSVAAHPGFARTNLLNAPGGSKLAAVGADLLAPVFGQGASDGALPQVLAATAPDVAPGSYWGPSRALEMKGPPGQAHAAPQGRDRQVAARLWDVSQRLTGFPFGEGL